MRKFTLIKYRKEDKVRENLTKGLTKVCDIVSKTFGPYARNVIIERSGKPPYICDDGITIARSLILEDEIENLGAQAAIDAAVRTNDMVGDGTTTTLVLVKAIVDEINKRFGDEEIANIEKANMVDIRKEIMGECEKVVAELKKMAKPLKNKKEIEGVAVISVQDSEYGKKIAEMVEQVGANGYIGVEEGFGYETEIEVVPGMSLPCKYISPMLATNERKEAIWEGALVLITNHKLQRYMELIPFVEEMMKKGKDSLVVIAPEYERNVIASMIAQSYKTTFKILGIKGAPLTEDELEDIATYTGGIFIDETKKMDFEKILREGYFEERQVLDANGNIKINREQKEFLGKARRVVADEEKTIIIEGGGNKKSIEKRIQLLKGGKEATKPDELKKKIERRIASLAGGVGMIRVASKTTLETRYLKQKIEDAVYATKAAMEEGVVPGGGLALLQIAKKMPESILAEALKSPYNKIQESAGGKLAIGKGILDPAKVTRTALENACSLAGMFITTDSAVAWERGGLKEEFDNILKDLATDEKRVERWRGRKDEIELAEQE